MAGRNRAKPKTKTTKRMEPSGPTQESAMANALRDLECFEAFQRDIPERLKQALLEGKDAGALYTEFADVAAARVVQIIMTEKDSGRALAAAKELLDRTYGKATERKKVSVGYENLSDKELDALLKAREAEIVGEDE